ncbi:hypothetical protein [Streptomyces olindensis]|uniref:hypothetical protein n=1 Tax=Streptomyces olindensis TaxID=358823 RepID=UPI003662C646
MEDRVTGTGNLVDFSGTISLGDMIAQLQEFQKEVGDNCPVVMLATGMPVMKVTGVVNEGANPRLGTPDPCVLIFQDP